MRAAFQPHGDEVGDNAQREDDGQPAANLPNPLFSTAINSDSIMSALVAGIHLLKTEPQQDVDGRNKSGHDEGSDNESLSETVGIVPV